MLRHLVHLLSLIVLAATGVGGLYNTSAEWPAAATPLQHLVSAGELAYGVLGVAAAVGLMRRRR